MRISVLSNVNLDMLSGLLKKEHEIFQTEGYGGWITYALQPDARLLAFAPECMILLLEGSELLGKCASWEAAQEELAQTEVYVKKLAECYPGSYLFVSTIDVRQERIRERDGADFGLRASAAWDDMLTRLAQENDRIHRLELRDFIENYGRRLFYSPKFWYMGSIPYEMKALHALAGEIGRTIKKLKIVRKKVLVLDLDNTLWGGVIGEDGVEGICLDVAHQGAIYRDAQREIKKMQKQGVLVAIASKNNIEDVRAVFQEHPHMILKEDDFAAIYADWNPKWDNVKRMAEELNLSLDAFVFVDDNEAEREGMKIHAPQVAVVDFPSDITMLADCMRDIYEEYFWNFRLTKEDQEKTMQYRQEKLRRDEQQAAASYEEYLKSLQTTIRLAEVTEEMKARAVQLMNKTNQFNVCTLRMDEPQLDKYQTQQNGRILMAEVSDKYGSSGWVAEFLYHIDKTTAVVDNFLMSCRVMGRCIENAIVEEILGKLFAQGVTKVRAFYHKTAKNQPVEQLWDKLGFVCVREVETGKEYALTLQEYKQRDKKEVLHAVVWE